MWTTSDRLTLILRLILTAPPYTLSGLKYRLRQRGFWDLTLTLLVFHFIWEISQWICITGTDSYLLKILMPASEKQQLDAGFTSHPEPMEKYDK